jgi:uncharacterized membrane protein YqjE
MGYLGLLIVPAFLVIDEHFLQKLWIFFTGLTILDLPPLMYIVNSKMIDSYIYTSSITLTILAYLSLIAMLYGISKSTKSINVKTEPKIVLLVFSSSLFFAIAYHGLNFYLKNYEKIPNEERSIFINGLEFHHINYGLVLLVLVPFLFKYASKLSSLKATSMYLFISFIYGTVFDECYYYMLSDMTDAAYLYPSVMGIQLLFMIIVFAVWYYIIKRKSIDAQTT